MRIYTDFMRIASYKQVTVKLQSSKKEVIIWNANILLTMEFA